MNRLQDVLVPPASAWVSIYPSIHRSTWMYDFTVAMTRESVYLHSSLISRKTLLQSRLRGAFVAIYWCLRACLLACVHA